MTHRYVESRTYTLSMSHTCGRKYYVTFILSAHYHNRIYRIDNIYFSPCINSTRFIIFYVGGKTYWCM